MITEKHWIDLIILHKEINKEANWVKDKETFQEVTIKMVDRKMVKMVGKKMVKMVGKKIDKVMDKRANQEVNQSHEKCRHPGGQGRALQWMRRSKYQISSNKRLSTLYIFNQGKEKKEEKNYQTH